MRVFLFLFILLISPAVIHAQSPAEPLLAAADNRLKANVRYDGRYMRIDYPGGDVPDNMGVCTDVIIRAYRAAYGFDFQKAVHEDISENFNAYPSGRIWGLTRPDRNIDHRRVPNLETYLTRAGHAVPITQSKVDYLPGDLVSWRLMGTGVPHIGIVSARAARNGTPLIIHNIGAGVAKDDILFDYKITGHFRFHPSAQQGAPAANED